MFKRSKSHETNEFEICPDCHVEKQYFADYGRGMHMVTKIQLMDCRLPPRRVLSRFPHKDHCKSTDAQAMRGSAVG